MALAYDYKDVHVLPTLQGRGEPVTALFRMGVTMAFAKDEEIYGQDEDADLIYRVLEGAVRTTRVTADGRRQIGDFYLAGDIFGLETGPAHRFAAEAVRDSVILVIKATVLRTSGEDMQRLGWEATRRELERAQEHVLLLGRKTACERVALRIKPNEDRPVLTGWRPWRAKWRRHHEFPIPACSRPAGRGLEAPHRSCGGSGHQA
ncbi:MAG: cyclic nucleotide-binding domain-containing protein [Phenylobacterium sp.]|nr:cyclic nucleotide-binding domain-containing protein [Phenylobacterium sp.]